ncbi:hypothetical protein AK812_SmicGene25754 [Symbiodinium microadriaticum]|uniref:Uncharacterized protein n=1 Tax=Symbiodinium microadriaticum TaxID=2951 RepID=A0A1Q9DB49_SYMMI|nr:hypothetical protein AK812_SmicGene25754 [Symbiodinium microadriaticum]
MSPEDFDTFVHRLFFLGAPKVLIFLVLLVWWLDISPDNGTQFLDYFSGKARLSLVAEGAGFKVAAYDKTYGDKRAQKRGKRSAMDLNSNAGMVSLDLQYSN